MMTVRDVFYGYSGRSCPECGKSIDVDQDYCGYCSYFANYSEEEEEYEEEYEEEENELI